MMEKKKKKTMMEPNNFIQGKAVMIHLRKTNNCGPYLSNIINFCVSHVLLSSGSYKCLGRPFKKHKPDLYSTSMAKVKLVTFPA